MKTGSKILIGVLVTLAVLSIIIISLNISVEDDNNNYNGRVDGYYTYSLETATYFFDSYGYIETPDPGYKYVIAEVTIRNINAKDGISNNSLYFDLVTGGSKRSTDFDTFSYPSYSLRSIMPGYSGNSFYVYQVPSSMDITNAYITYDGFDDLKYDPSKFK